MTKRLVTQIWRGFWLASVTLISGGIVAGAIAADYEAAVYKRTGKIEANDKLESANDRSIRVQAKDNDFGIAFGLAPGLSAPGQFGRGMIVTLESSSHKDEPCWEVTQAGYAAARGWRPRIRGTTATAAAVGCTIIFERQIQLERVYFPMEETASMVEVWLRDVDAPPITLMPGQFVEVEMGRTEPLTEADIKNIAEVPGRGTYVSRVLALPIVFELPETRPPETSTYYDQ